MPVNNPDPRGQQAAVGLDPRGPQDLVAPKGVPMSSCLKLRSGDSNNCSYKGAEPVQEPDSNSGKRVCGVGEVLEVLGMCGVRCWGCVGWRMALVMS